MSLLGYLVSIALAPPPRELQMNDFSETLYFGSHKRLKKLSALNAFAIPQQPLNISFASRH